MSGNPAWLIRVATDPDPQAAIDTARNNAGKEVGALLRAHPEYTGALQKLVLKGYDTGDEGIAGHEFDEIS